MAQSQDAAPEAISPDPLTRPQQDRHRRKTLWQVSRPWEKSPKTVLTNESSQTNVPLDASCNDLSQDFDLIVTSLSDAIANPSASLTGGQDAGDRAL
jgi:hypothetical protein